MFLQRRGVKIQYKNTVGCEDLVGCFIPYKSLKYMKTQLGNGQFMQWYGNMPQIAVLVALFVSVATGWVTMKVYGNIAEVGYYYTVLWVGTPPMKRTLLLDTGSSLTGFPCEECAECGKHSGKYFSRSNSHTARLVTCSELSCHDCRNDTCHYQLQYSEGSIVTGTLTEDFAMTDKKHGQSFALLFGCHDFESNLFRTQKADGVLGLSLSPAKSYVQTIIDAHYSQGLIPTTDFAICLSHQGGLLTFGGFNPHLDQSLPRSVRLHGFSHYEVRLQGLSLDLGPLLPTETRTTLIDSGTTFTYFQSSLYEAVVAQFRAACKGICGDEIVVPGEKRPCYRHSLGPLTSFFSRFPTIHLWLDDLKIPWKPQNYLFSWSDRPHDYCLSFYPSSTNVLGSSFMRGFHLIFSRSNQTLSISQSKCDIRSGIAEVPRTETASFGSEGVVLVSVTVVICGLLLIGPEKALNTVKKAIN